MKNQVEKYFDLINELKREKYLERDEVYKAFKKIRRKDFLKPEDSEMEHLNSPVPIGFGQTNSQPLTVALMIGLLDPKKNSRILDIGCGSGWTTALLAEIVGDKGKVFGIDIIPELVNFARNNISKYNYLKAGTVDIILGNGYNGLPEQAPFDRILVSAGAEKIPYKLLEQLKKEGILVIPVGTGLGGQTIKRIIKLDNNNFQEQDYPGFVFVPLVNNN